MKKEQREDLLTLVRMTYHGLENLDDPVFSREEISYKRKAAEKAAELLTETELGRLIEEGNLVELKTRVSKVGATNLLWNSVPMQGDLALFNSEQLDIDVFVEFNKLLHGSGSSDERLQSWSDYLDKRSLNNKWTTPTYFMFLCDPGSEYFVKPGAASWLLRYYGDDISLPAKPSGPMYARLKEHASDALEAFRELGAQDMIHVQSLIWVAHQRSSELRKQMEAARSGGASDFAERAKKSGFQDLAARILRHVISAGPLTNEMLTALIHLFKHGRSTPDNIRKNLAICGAEEFAEELIGRQDEGGYTAVGRLAVEGLDRIQLEAVRKLLQKVSQAGSFDEVAAAVDEYEQAGVPIVEHGIYSPWLHYLQPDYCPILNGPVIESYKALGLPRDGSYVEAMRIARAVAHQLGTSSRGDIDVMFYLEGKRGPSSDTGASIWKIAPGENARQWDECRDKGFIAIGWDKMGNVIGLDEKQFWARHQEVLRQNPDLRNTKGWSKGAVKQLWDFVNLKPGDVVLANKGKTLVLGIGTVTGEPFFVSGATYAHRLPVNWYDTEPRLVDKPGWVRTMLKLDKSDLDAIAASTPSGDPEADIPGFRTETIDLLRHALEKLDISTPDDHRVALELVRKGRMLSLYFGDWLLVSVPSSNYPDLPVTMNLDTRIYSQEGFERTDKYADTESNYAVFHLPMHVIETDRDSVLSAFDSAISRAYTLYSGWSRTPHRKENSLLYLARLLGVDLPPRHDEDEIEESVPTHQTPYKAPYSIEEMSSQTGHSIESIKQWIDAIQRKKQAIIYGPPGTGKTYIAEHLARHLVSQGSGFVRTIQFHPSYTYEDFMQGIRPEPREGGGLAFPIKPGHFLEFCREARARSPHTCVMIIDEINRANLSKVFGELMYLLEYRERSIPLAAGEQFSIPSNTRIIGTMNTADRSIALVDFALRRRFAFVRLEPQMDLLRRKLSLSNPDFPSDKLIGLLEEMNRAIGDDGFKIGITYFLGPDLMLNIQSIWMNEIEPYIEEYFFERPELADQYRWRAVSGRLAP